MLPAKDTGSPRSAALAGLRAAIGVPGIILSATYVGFGSLVRESGLTFLQGLTSTATAWAAPGQVILAELYAVGASVLVITLAVALTNARLLPMTVALMPHLRARRTPIWAYYLAAHYIAVTGWAQALRVCPDLPPEQRLPYFLGCAVTLWVCTLFATALGFLLAGSVPQTLATGLVFLNPVYFMLVLMMDLRQRARSYALVLGALCGPLFHTATPEWGLLLTGLVAGSAAYGIDRFRRSE